MPKDYALRKLHSKEEKIIFCGCDAISGLLIHYLLDELFGRGEYKILHHYDLRLQKEWEWTIDEPIPDKDIIKEWFLCEPERIITTCWSSHCSCKSSRVSVHPLCLLLAHLREYLNGVNSSLWLLEY